MIGAGMIATALTGLPLPLLAGIFTVALIGMTIVMRLPVVERAVATV